MATAAVDIESHVADLSDGSFEAFCEDIAGMFDADVTCERQEVGTGTVQDLCAHFKKLAAVHHVEATGTLAGPFHLFFDQGGLFILAGVIVMLPEGRIREEVKRGSVDDAEGLTDAVREVGNLLVGSWDRVFREGCEGHDHFVKTGTFIGKPWENTDELSLSADTELMFVTYEMTVEPYPSFRCAAVFPKATMGQGTEPAAEPDQAQATEEQPVAQPQQPAQPQDAPAAAAQASQPTPAETTEATQAAPAEPLPTPQALSTETTESQDAPPAAQAEAPQPDQPQPTPKAPAERDEPKAGQEPVEAPAPSAGQAADSTEPTQIPADIQPVVDQVVGDADDSDTEPDVDLPAALAAFVTKPEGEHRAAAVPEVQPPVPPAATTTGPPYAGRGPTDLSAYARDTAMTETLAARARDIMTAEVVWCEPDDTVQSVVAKMQQHNTGYVLVGSNGVLQGLLSNSNILGAVSPYLRPMFAKWRRPEDDATLEIKVKWLMSRPVRTVTPDATLGSMIESMRRYGGRCLPVVDNQGQVQGIITVFDILLRVLEADKTFSWEGAPPQAPPFLI